MKCPTCDTALTIADRQGIEIDFCPHCRGVWLDRGELDKIVERSVTKKAMAYEDDEDDDGDYPTRRAGRGEDRSGSYPPNKRRSFLSDLFDFG